MCSCLITVIIRVRGVLRGIWAGAVDCRRFPGGSDIKEFGLPAMQEIWVQSLGREDSPGEGSGNPLQYSCLEIPWMEEPGRLQSMEWQRVRQD